MKKFLHVTYIVLMRILIFILLLAASPMWILFGIFLAFSVLFGSGDDFISPDYDEYKEEKGNGCPEYVEKMDQLENNTEIPTDN